MAEQPKILIDIREQASGFIELIQRTPNLPFVVETAQLQIGDVQLFEDTVIEIKRISRTSNDVRASLFDGRIHDQAQKMQSFRLKMVIYEIELDAVMFDTYFTEDAFESLNKTLAFQYDIHVYQTQSMQQTIDMLIAIYNKLTHPHKRNPCNPEPRLASLLDQQRYFLSGFPDVGKEKTLTLLKYFKTPISIIKWICTDVALEQTKSGKWTVKGSIEGFGAEFHKKARRVLLETASEVI